jgi:heat shock protein HtpX
MALCTVLLGTIVLLAWYASRLLFYGAISNRRSSARGGGGAQLIILAIAIILIILAPIMAQLIYLAISRRREYLADASAALYTRYPEGLASALERIATSPIELKSANKATAPMYIVNPFRSERKDIEASSLTSTHPSIWERIKILRSMAGGASLVDYDKAYRQSHQSKKGVIPASALVGAPALAVREPQTAEKEPETIERARETSDVLWKYSDYGVVNCECGAKLRLPPKFRGNSIQCPHCGRAHPSPFV